jgi:hypothetical protein
MKARSHSATIRLVAGLLSLLAVALGLRLYGLGTWSLWLDEALQYDRAARPVPQLVCSLPRDWLILPILMTKLQILAHFDANEWQLRLCSVLFGTAVAYSIFLLAREMFDQRVGWLAAWLAAAWPGLIEYSQDVRPYALFVLLASIAGLGLLRAARTNATRDWIAFSATAILELLVHPLALLNVFSFFLFAIVLASAGSILGPNRTSAGDVRPSRSSYLLKGGVAFGGIGIGFLSVLPFYLISTGHYEGRGILPLDFRTLHMIFGAYLGVGTGAAAIVLLLCAVVGLAVAWRSCRQAAALGLVWIAVPFIFARFHSGGDRLRESPRFLLFVLPVLLPFVAAGALRSGEALAKFVSRYHAFANRVHRNAAIALPCVLLAGFVIPPLLHLYAENPKDVPVDLRSAYSRLRARATPQDVIIGIGEPEKWSSEWFRETDGYFFRPRIAATGMRVIPLQAEPPFPKPRSMPLRQIDAATGQLFAIVVVGGNEERTVRTIAGNEYDTACWERVCVLQSSLNLPMAARLDDLLRRFAFLDPPAFTRVLSAHDRIAHETKPQ